MTVDGRDLPALSRIANVWKALMDRFAACRGARSIAASSAVAVPTSVAATSAADRLAPGNSCSKWGGTRMIASSRTAPMLRPPRRKLDRVSPPARSDSLLVPLIPFT